MPDFWTHIIGGIKIKDKLNNEKWKNTLNNNQHLFNFACQGPDFFFYNDFWPWIKNKRGPVIGNKLHEEKTKELLISNINFLKTNQTNSKFNLFLTYVIGFIAHYVIDKTTHPFIYQRTTNYPEHKKLEINIDTYLVNQFWNQQAYQLSPAQVIDLNDKKITTVVKPYYQYILKEVYNSSKKVNYIADSYHDFKKVLTLFYSPYRIKKQILKIINFSLPLDISILTYPKKINHNLLTVKEYQKFNQLLDRAVKEGIQFLNMLNDYLNFNLDKEKLNSHLSTVSFKGE